MRSVLLLSATTGYQVRAFGEAAAALGVELVFATDRCRGLDDPWRDRALPVRFHEEARSIDLIARAAAERPIHGVLALGDRPTVLAALAAERLGLPGHAPAAARVASNKRLARERLRDAGLPVPWFTSVRLDADPAAVAPRLRYPVRRQAPGARRKPRRDARRRRAGVRGGVRAAAVDPETEGRAGAARPGQRRGAD